MRKTIVSSIIATVVLSTSGVVVWSQQPSGSTNNQSTSQENSAISSQVNDNSTTSDRQRPSPQSPKTPKIHVYNFSSGVAAPGVTRNDQEHLRQFVQLISALRATTDEPERLRILDSIRDEVSIQFDLDLAKREEELAEIESRVARMRSQLETGRKNREATLDSLMTMIENPNLGLGIRREWFDAIVNQTPIDPGSQDFTPEEFIRNIGGNRGTRVEPGQNNRPPVQQAIPNHGVNSGFRIENQPSFPPIGNSSN